MAEYIVTVTADAREVYEVTAETPEEAAANVYQSGRLVTQEVSVGDVVKVEESNG